MSQDENSVIPIELSLDDKAMLAAYLKNNLNATRAWMATHPNAKYDSARASGSEWLAKPNIKSEVNRILTENLMTEEELMWRFSAIAKADLYPFIRIDDDGFVYFNFSDEQAQEFLFLVKEIETKRERRVEGKGEDAETWEGEWFRVKLHDAYAAMRDVAKMKGKLADRHELTGAGGKDLNIIIRKASDATDTGNNNQ
jgi:phage terminase small subunit